MIKAFMPGSTRVRFHHPRSWAIFVPRSYQGQVLDPILGSKQSASRRLSGWRNLF
jgi:hypothetical protein